MKTKLSIALHVFITFVYLKLEEEKKKKKPEESAGKGGATSWRWEKQDLEKQLREAKKKADDLHSELTRQQFKWKMAGDDIAKVSADVSSHIRSDAKKWVIGTSMTHFGNTTQIIPSCFGYNLI